MKAFIVLLLSCVGLLAQNVINPYNFQASLTPPTLVRASTNFATGVSSFTISGFDCSGGNFLLVKLNFTSGLTRTITSVSCNAVACTNIYTTNWISTSGGKVAIYGLVNPTTGNVVITLNGAPNNMSYCAELWNNVGGVSASSADFLNSARTSTSDSLTTISTDVVSDILATGLNVGTAGGGQTVDIQNNPPTAATSNTSHKTGASGSTSMAWTFSSQAVSWAGCVLNGK